MKKEYKRFDKKKRIAIYGKAHGKCALCSKKITKKEGQIDHIVPNALGGAPIESNGQLLCIECHKLKTAIDVKNIRKVDRIQKKGEKYNSKFIPPRIGGIRFMPKKK